VDIFIEDPNDPVRRLFDLLGTPLVALLIAVVVAMFTLGRGSGMDKARIGKCVDSSLPAIAGIILASGADELPFLINAATFAFMAVVLWTLPRSATRVRSWWSTRPAM